MHSLINTHKVCLLFLVFDSVFQGAYVISLNYNLITLLKPGNYHCCIMLLFIVCYITIPNRTITLFINS